MATLQIFKNEGDIHMELLYVASHFFIMQIFSGLRKGQNVPPEFKCHVMPVDKKRNKLNIYVFLSLLQ